MQVTTTADGVFPSRPMTFADLKLAAEGLMKLDFPKEVRCSEAYFDFVMTQLQPASPTNKPDAPWNYGLGLFGLPISVDKEMTGITAKCIYTSGRVEDISPNFGLLDRCFGRDESKEQPS